MQEEDDSPIHGDLLEFILARVPLIDLACACRVSKLWEYAVSSSLVHFNKVKPWLVIQTQCMRSLNEKTAYAYDPRSSTWIEITNQRSSSTTKYASIIRSSNSNLLYVFSLTGLSFSADPLHLTWHRVAPPLAWRVDPIVALIGSHIVVAGGALGFEDDPLAVKMYDMETSHWSPCQSMPDILKHSAASTWLSVAANQNTMYVIEKASGIACSFSPQTKAWSRPYDLRPDPTAFFSAVGFAGDDLILAGVMGHAQSVKTLKLWKIKPEAMEFDQIGEIPSELLEKLKGEASELSSISLLTAENFVYIYNNSDPVEIILCEIGDGECEWGSVKNLVVNDERRIGERMVMSCGMVGIADLRMALGAANRKVFKNSDPIVS